MHFESLLILTFLLLLGLLSEAKPIIQHSNQAKTLWPRQCEWDPQTNAFVCDDNLPTLQQMVDKMRDPNVGGKVNANRPAIFYSKLGELSKVALWIFGWTRTAHLTPNYYWLYGCIDTSPTSCKLKAGQGED